jgi:hypothetical protein
LLFKFLFLAHLIADFPLQFGRLYKYKKESLKGQCAHAGACLLIMLGAGYPLLAYYPYWLVACFIAAAHLVIDYFKMNVLDRVARKHNTFIFLFDQALHAASICVVFATGLESTAVLRDSYIANLNSSGALDVTIMFLIATFFAAYLFCAADTTFLRRQDGNGYPLFMKWYGITERGLLFFVMFAGGLCLLLLPLIIAARIPIANHYAKQFKYIRFLNNPYNIAVNVSTAMMCAVTAALMT